MHIFHKIMLAAIALVGCAVMGAALYKLGCPDWIGRGVAMGGALTASRILWG